MNRHVLIALAAGLALFVLPLAAQEIDFSGSLITQAGVGLPNTHDNKGDFLLGQTMFDGIMKSYFAESMVYVNAQIVYDAPGAQSANGFFAFASDDGTFALKFREAYMDWKSERFALRIGRQIAAWGKADDIQIADILCPQDESTVIASKYEENRLGIDAVRLSLLMESAQVDAYWIPFFTPSTLPLARGNPLRSHMFPEYADGYKVASPSAWNDFDCPEKTISNSEFAARAGFYTSVADLSFYGFYGWDDMPFMTYTGNRKNSGDDFESITITGEYKRMAMVGADAAIPVGDFVFRLETAYFPNRHIQMSSDSQIEAQFMGEAAVSTKKKHQLKGLAGFDWTPSGGWTITAQYVGDYIFNHEDSLDRESYEHQATLSIEKTLLGEDLTLSASGSLDLRDFSSSSELEADYKLSDAITLSAIADFFLEGPNGKKGMFGDYHDLSCVTLKGKFSF
ncbi:MAG: hypothetical protein IJP62_02275 [Treponema sp.]|nr:hypothetical protein [Treponema sp.]